MTFGRLIDMKKQGKLGAQILLQIDNHEVWGECRAFNSPFDPAAGKLADCFNTGTMCIYVEFSIIKKYIYKETLDQRLKPPHYVLGVTGGGVSVDRCIKHQKVNSDL